jgi:uncharacterized protein (DUF1015 family)
LAARVAAAPYDTYSRREAAAEIHKHPLSFLRIDKPAALLPDSVDEYAPEVYALARQQLDGDFAAGVFVLDDVSAERDTAERDTAEQAAAERNAAERSAAQESTDGQATSEKDTLRDALGIKTTSAPAYYYVYRLIQDDHVQTGLVACVAATDYDSAIIKRHENTRAHKQQDRVDHINALGAHTGPVLLTYRSCVDVDAALQVVCAAAPPLFDFAAFDGVRHQVWRVADRSLQAGIQAAFANLDSLYIADGHHRAAAAALIAAQRRASFEASAEALTRASTGALAGASLGASTGASHFLAVLFGDDQMRILDYNRVVSTLGGHTPARLLELVAARFNLEKQGTDPYRPDRRGTIALYLDGCWYKLSIDPATRSTDSVDSLDIAILHSNLLAPLLGITDPRSDPHIAYVGGSRGLEELARRADAAGGAAFALYPCSMTELFTVADAGRLMPPKSTWFEPKPASGLFIHRL